MRAKEEEKSLSLDTPADVPMTPFTRMFWSSTACRKPEWLAKARNPLEKDILRMANFPFVVNLQDKLPGQTSRTNFQDIALHEDGCV